MKTQFILSASALVLLTACGDSGANYRPILDGTPNAAFETDLADCQALARTQYDQDTLGATVLGAGAGALLGEIDSGDALGGAVAGALAGGISSAVDVSEQREAIVIECMRGRGHRVVG